MPLRTVVLLIVFAAVALFAAHKLRSYLDTRLGGLENSLSAQLGEMRERLDR